MFCKTCLHYEEVHPKTENVEGLGRCRRYAPRPHHEEEWQWPNVDADDYCGEYKEGFFCHCGKRRKEDDVFCSSECAKF